MLLDTAGIANLNIFLSTFLHMKKRPKRKEKEANSPFHLELYRISKAVASIGWHGFSESILIHSLIYK